MDEAVSELKESLAALTEAGGDVAADARVLADAVISEVQEALDELGKQTPEYPTPVRNAIDILNRVVEDLKA